MLTERVGGVAVLAGRADGAGEAGNALGSEPHQQPAGASWRCSAPLPDRGGGVAHVTGAGLAALGSILGRGRSGNLRV